MRQGMIGLQLGAHQKYYISQCEEKQSIQLTITVAGDDLASRRERKKLIDDMEFLLDDIMKVFMPATKKPALFVPCSLCSTLHIPLDDVHRDRTIFCPNSNDTPLSSGYYQDLRAASSGSYISSQTSNELIFFVLTVISIGQEPVDANVYSGDL